MAGRSAPAARAPRSPFAGGSGEGGPAREPGPRIVDDSDLAAAVTGKARLSRARRDAGARAGGEAVLRPRAAVRVGAAAAARPSPLMGMALNSDVLCRGPRPRLTPPPPPRARRGPLLRGALVVRTTRMMRGRRGAALGPGGVVRMGARLVPVTRIGSVPIRVGVAGAHLVTCRRDRERPPGRPERGLPQASSAPQSCRAPPACGPARGVRRRLASGPGPPGPGCRHHCDSGAGRGRSAPPAAVALAAAAAAAAAS